MSGLDHALIGNCAISALVNPRGKVEWMCWPRFDSDPVFNALVNGDAPEAGFFDIEIVDFTRAEQRYRRNSAVVETILHDAAGHALRIIDFCPRFRHFDRYHRPSSLLRIVEPVEGTPRIRICCRPSFDYGALMPEITRGSNHIRYAGNGERLRLSTDVPIAYILEETDFVLDRRVHLILGADEPLRAPIPDTAEQFLEETTVYWMEFSRGLYVPFEWQEAVIRAAITLKLSAFEETGGIVAAATTSIPEAPNSGRNWDYRFCWLRDAWFVVNALNRLGTTRTMEDYLRYIVNLIAASDEGYLPPLFRLTRAGPLEERECPALAGYRGMGPVRRGNAAWSQVQNDSYGALVLAVTQVFFDQRLERPGDLTLYRRLEMLGEQATRRWNTPDAGLWELRTRQRVHTFSAVMCWAACDRLARIGRVLGEVESASRWQREADTMHSEICAQAYNEKIGSFVESFGGEDLDAALLLLSELGFISADDPRFRNTVAASERYLRRGDYLFRYHTPDDFGVPETSFSICTFWFINALAAIGRRDEARELFQNMLDKRNPVGLLSEDLDGETGELWGNFPQTYSMVGLINAAMRLSRSWEEAL